MDNNMMFHKKEETKQGAAGISTQNGLFSAGFEPHDAERVTEPYLAGTHTQNNGNQYAYESQINQGISYNIPYNSQNEKQPSYTYGNSVNTNEGGSYGSSVNTNEGGFYGSSVNTNGGGFYGSSVNTNDNSSYGNGAYTYGSNSNSYGNDINTYGNSGGNNNLAPAVPAPINRTFGGNQGFVPNNNMPNGNGAFTQTEPELEEPVSVGDWLLLNLLFLIPCVGLVMAIVWAFSDREKKSKSNFCKAYLIFTLIMLAVSILITFVAAVIVAASL